MSSGLKTTQMTDLIVVVDPDYADHVDRAAQFAPVWVVATQRNRAACERLWRSDPHPDHRDKGAVTCYNAPNPEDRLESLLDIIPDLETHHGEVKDDELVFPDGFVLEVIGLALVIMWRTRYENLALLLSSKHPRDFKPANRTAWIIAETGAARFFSENRETRFPRS